MGATLLRVQTEDLECESCELTEHRRDRPTMARLLIPKRQKPSPRAVVPYSLQDMLVETGGLSLSNTLSLPWLS